VIIAADRAARPYTAQAAPPPSGPATCPFCPGHEHETPPEACRTGPGEPETPGWRVRVVPNLYPIVGPDPTTGDATGAHEVVVFCPDHDRGLAELDDAQVVELFTVLRDRVAFHLRSGRAFACAFVNHGRAAGASIEHPHAQIIAPDAPAAAVVEMTERFTTDLVAQELAAARRADLVVVDGPAPAWCPPASWSPYQLRVAHRSTRARFDEATDAEVQVVAIATRDALAAVARALPGAPYNIVVHSAPPGVPTREMHWHVDVVPRTSVIAGFELGSGEYANAVAPEQAAELLRRA
ncbi:MAG: galactose-1-phosphate uridylyltransferase, partial [Acidimicrobiia bacterium]